MKNGHFYWSSLMFGCHLVSKRGIFFANVSVKRAYSHFLLILYISKVSQNAGKHISEDVKFKIFSEVHAMSPPTYMLCRKAKTMSL